MVVSPPPVATVTLTATRMTVFMGQAVELSWTSGNATSCTASGGWSGSRSLSGSESIEFTLGGQQDFDINCSGATATVSIMVNSDDNEGSCVNPHSAKIPRAYLGNYVVPSPQNYFASDSLKAIGLKDYGVDWIYSNHQNYGASWIDDCTRQQYIKLMYRRTLSRLKDHGVGTVWVYNFGYWQDDQDETWQIDHSSKHLADWVIEYIADIAESKAMTVHYAWQFLPQDSEGDSLFPFDGSVSVDLPLLTKIMDAHEEHIYWEATRLETLSVQSMSADWSAMWLCFCGLEGDASDTQRDELKHYFMERMGSIVDGIRARFSGKIYVGEGITWNDERLFDKVDGVIFNLPSSNLITDAEAETASVDLIKERVAEHIVSTYNQWYCLDGYPCWSRTSYIKPKIIFNLFAQSHALFLSRGWVEDGFCTSGTYANITASCIQNELPTDFSAQAIWIEGMLRAIDVQASFETLGTTASTAYWLSDSLMPGADQYPASTQTLEGFPNLSQSVRGKPAENIIKYWYTGEYSVYEPEFVD